MGGVDPVLHPAQLRSVVAVGVDDDLDSSLDRLAHHVRRGIEAIEGPVDLEGDIKLEQGFEDDVDLDLDARAPADLAAR